MSEPRSEAGTAAIAERSTLHDVVAYRSADAVPCDGAPQWRFDLSNNELAHPPLPSVLAAVEAGLPLLGRYPDPTAHALTERIAEHLCVPEDAVAVGPGSAGVLQQLLLALCGQGDEVVYAWPGFDAYPLLVAVCGARSVQVPLTDAGEHDLDALRARVGPATRMVILCSPHNPTGTVLDPARLRSFLASLPAHVVTVLDEAYVEFDREADPPGHPDELEYPGAVVVLRTFSKAHGLAGLRVGYAVGPPPVVAAVRKTALPFGVTSLAEQAAMLSLQCGDELHTRLTAVSAAREELIAGLRALDFPVPASHANFVWVPLPAAETARFAGIAADAGVKVRAYPEHGVRISVGRPEAHRTLLAALDRADPGHRP